MTDDPSKYLTSGAWYRIQGPNNLVLCDENGLNLRYAGSGDLGSDGWQAWWADERGWRFENWTTGRTIRATTPPRPDGGPPVPPPARGAPVYMADGGEQRYELWALYPQALPDKYALQAYNCFDRDSAMFLNVKGNADKWNEMASELITWEWSRGQPNEIWWFQEVDPQPDPTTRG